MSKRIPLSIPHLSGTESKYVNEAIDTGWVTSLGPNVDQFEISIQHYLDQNVHVAALSSGTAAIHLGLILLGVEAGDEVICQSMTFSATANPIVYLGASPVFIDSEKDSWNIDPQLLEDGIKNRVSKGKKPKAIIPVHLYGMPAKMNDIMNISKKYDIPVLEDAAEAFGSVYKGTKCGAIGEMACLSFNGNKIITTSGGGALITQKKEDCEKAKFLATQARDDAPHYQHSHIGYNYRMSNIVAGVGRGQIEVLDRRVAARRKNFEFYKQSLQGIECISFQNESEGMFSNRWLTTIVIDPEKCNRKSREDVRLALQAEIIETRPLWKPMHLQPVFEKYSYYGNGVSDELFEKGLCLPSGSDLSEDQLQRVVDEIKKVLL